MFYIEGYFIKWFSGFVVLVQVNKAIIVKTGKQTNFACHLYYFYFVVLFVGPLHICVHTEEPGFQLFIFIPDFLIALQKMYE